MTDEDETAAVFGAAAHEIKNALGPLAMTLQIAERQLLADQPIPPADLAFARAQVRRVSRLCEDLMDLTRIDLRALEICPATVDAREVVTETVEMFRRGHARTVALELPEHPLPASIDAVRIQQVLLNLLENAARYSPEGAPIAVAASPATDNRVRVLVRDQGPGIAADEQQRIFDRFVRGEAAKSKGGLGIGLYLCRIIVEGHGGSIGIDSQPGAGATFWFQLPAGP